MSHFDKLVAQWVTRDDNTVAASKKAEILNSVSANIDVYRELKDPGKAAKKKEQKEQEEAQPAADREASPAAPVKKTKKTTKKKKSTASATPATTTTTTASKPRRSSKSVGGTPRAGLSSQHQSATPAAAVPQTARTRSSIDMSVIDFRFSRTVKEALRKVNGEMEQERAQSEPAPAPVPHAGEPTEPKETRSRSRPAMTLSTEDLEQEVPPAAHAPNTESVVVDGEHAEEEAVAAAADAAGHTPHDVNETLPLDHDDHDDHDLEKETASVEARTQYEKGAMSAFRFGDAVDEDASSEVSHLNDTANGAEPADEPPEIADDEDERRRQAQAKRPSRMGISDVSISLEEARLANFPETPKSRDKVKVITRTLERHFLFSYLDDSDLSKIASIMDVETFEAGEEVIAKGALSDTMFLVLSGEAETTMINEYDQSEAVPLGRGATFGDLGLMYASTSEMTVVAKSHLECASLERHTYKLITSRSMADRRKRYAEFLKEIPEFQCLTEVEIRRLAEALKQSTYEKGQKLIAYGTPSNWLYFVVEGALDVRGRDAQGEPCHLTTLHEGDYAGHLEFLSRHVCVADVVADSDVVRTAKLSRRMFDSLVGNARDLLSRRVEEGDEYTYYRRCMSETPPQRDLSPAFDEPPLYLKSTIRDQDALNAALLAVNGDDNADETHEENEEESAAHAETEAPAQEAEEILPPHERRNTAAPVDE